jgi:DNA processing protein
MQQFPLYEIDPIATFPQLAEIPEPPKKLFVRGSLDRIQDTILINVVGSRKNTSYGKEVCMSLIEGLKGYPITIVSGLAIGIDSIAHEAAMHAGLPTISFPGSGLDWHVLYPAIHRDMALRILQEGGALISEYEHDVRAAHWTFPRRNRLLAGMSAMTIVIEAEEKSGTLITARLATEYNRTVGAVPGPITKSTSVGANRLLRLGAVPITKSEDILIELNLIEGSHRDADVILNIWEEKILALLDEPMTKEEIIEKLSLDESTASIVFSTLEIKGMTRETLGLIERMS